MPALIVNTLLGTLPHIASMRWQQMPEPRVLDLILKANLSFG